MERFSEQSKQEGKKSEKVDVIHYQKKPNSIVLMPLESQRSWTYRCLIGNDLDKHNSHSAVTTCSPKGNFTLK